MSFSIQRETSDGTLSTIDLAIEYIDQADISVFVDDVIIEMTGGVTPYTWEWVTSSQIKITPDVANGLVAMVRRGTPNDAMYHNFNAGATFKDETMDENFLQLLYLVQEAKEGSGATDFYANLDMHGYIIRNHGAAILDSDLVTLGQYRNDALGASANRVATEAARDVAVAAKDTAVASANAAATSESNAATSETNASTSANAADVARIAAEAAAITAVAAFDDFDDRYLGSKASDPGVDNDGDVLEFGALYWNTTVSELRVFNGVWLSVALLPNTYLQIAQNLADLDDAPTARTNLGLGNVDNTSDANKPISTAQAAGLVGQSSSTGAAHIPAGTTAQRDPSPGFGDQRANTTTGVMEWWDGSVWRSMGGITAPLSTTVSRIPYFGDTVGGTLLQASQSVSGDYFITPAFRVGTSGNPVQNFEIVSGVDGTFTFRRQDGTQILKINADGSITGPFLGSGQTRQDKTAVRAPGVTYTNSSNRPIWVSITFGLSNASGVATLSIAGQEVGIAQAFTGGAVNSFGHIVLPGETYVLSVNVGTLNMRKWFEVTI